MKIQFKKEVEQLVKNCRLSFLSLFVPPGAHVNPAVSLAMVILGKLPVKKFPVYVVAQFLGAFAGSCAVYGLYYGECASPPRVRSIKQV